MTSSIMAVRSGIRIVCRDAIWKCRRGIAALLRTQVRPHGIARHRQRTHGVAAHHGLRGLVLAGECGYVKEREKMLRRRYGARVVRMRGDREYVCRVPRQLLACGIVEPVGPI